MKSSDGIAPTARHAALNRQSFAHQVVSACEVVHVHTLTTLIDERDVLHDVIDARPCGLDVSGVVLPPAAGVACIVRIKRTGSAVELLEVRQSVPSVSSLAGSEPSASSSQSFRPSLSASDTSQSAMVSS